MQRNPSKAERVARAVVVATPKAIVQAQKRAMTAERLSQNERASKQIALCPRMDCRQGGHP